MIPITQIDQVSIKCHRRRIIYELEAFYQDPENMKRFEAWKAARNEEAAKKGEPL